MKVTQSGNVLFYILIAVALLAALSFATTQGTRGGGGQISKEQARIDAVEIIEYGNMLAQVVSQLRLRGCDETELSFDAPTSAIDYENTSAPSDETCHIFSLSGGGITFDQELSFLITAGYSVAEIGLDPDTDLLIDFTVDQETCKSINNRLGIDNDGSDGPPSDKMGGGSAFQGAYTAVGGVLADYQAAGVFSGKTAGCRTNSGSGASAVFKYYNVLLSR